MTQPQIQQQSNDKNPEEDPNLLGLVKAEAVLEFFDSEAYINWDSEFDSIVEVLANHFELEGDIRKSFIDAHEVEIEDDEDCDDSSNLDNYDASLDREYDE